MNRRQRSHGIVRVIAVFGAAIITGCTSMPSGPLTITEQGSFFVAGRKVQAPGNYDPTKSAAGADEGQAFWVDQMYVQYQIPQNRRKLPLILVHGGSGKHCPRTAHHHLAVFVLRVSRNQLGEAISVLLRWGEAVQHKPDPCFAHPQASLGVVIGKVRRGFERAL